MEQTNEKLNIVSEIVCDDIELLFNKLDIKLKKSNSHYYGPGFCHGGNNNHALSIYPQGHTVRGWWTCRTHSCENIFKSTIIGFTRAVLSHQKFAWRDKTCKFVSLPDTLDFLTKLYKIDIATLRVDPDEVEKRKFLQQTSWFMPRLSQQTLITREQVRAKLKYPCEYFLKRGFSHEVLDKYDVGYCDDPTKEMYGRAVIPVYDEDGKYMMGCTGRTTFEVTEDNPKWKHNKNFRTTDFLFNLWFAKHYIKQSKIIILVESPGNCMRLEEAGIHNSVALLGCQLSDSQQFYLERIGVMTVILIMDGDNAGKEATERITREIKNFYNVKSIYLDSRDIADMCIDEIHKFISPNLGEK